MAENLLQWDKLIPSMIILALILLPGFSAADCECGYSVATGDDHNIQVFTDLLEADFLHINYVGAESNHRGWATQVFNMSADEARGRYGESFVAPNVQGNLIEDFDVWTGGGADGEAAGLQMVVDSATKDGMVLGAQVATTEGEYFHGSYRASIKITAVGGTCTAFFWYFNDTQEIDLEFLSREFDSPSSTYPVKLVLQNPGSKAAGYDASRTDTFVTANLSFDPAADFHEYRFDFLEDRVLFYADGILLAAMNDSTGAVPTTSGNLILSHWSNGNPQWSGGPPREDAASVVRYVKAYYNSSSETRKSDFETRCSDPGREGAVCGVPDANATFFFMYQTNMTVNQTTYGDGDGGGKGNDAAGSREKIGVTMALGVTFAAVMWVCGL